MLICTLCQHTKSNLFYVNVGVDLVYIHNKSNVSKHIGNYLACPNKYKNVNDMLYVNYLCIYCMCWKIFIWIQSIDTYMCITWKQVWTMEKNIIEVYKFQTPWWTEVPIFFNYKEVNWYRCTSCVTLIIKQYM